MRLMLVTSILLPVLALPMAGSPSQGASQDLSPEMVALGDSVFHGKVGGAP